MTGVYREPTVDGRALRVAKGFLVWCLLACLALALVYGRRYLPPPYDGRDAAWPEAALLTGLLMLGQWAYWATHPAIRRGRGRGLLPTALGLLIAGVGGLRLAVWLAAGGRLGSPASALLAMLCGVALILAGARWDRGRAAPPEKRVAAGNEAE
jgi:hypothetical protein